MTESQILAKLQKREVIHFIKGVNDHKRRRVWPRPKERITSHDGKSVYVTNNQNPHRMHDRWDGKWEQQSLRDDQVVCDVELEPGKIVQQVIRRHRIQVMG